jgi:ribonuclease HI
MNAPLSRVVLYTDGGADPNPGPGGWGAVLLHTASGKRVELSGGEPHTTNNRMELTAAIRSLEALKQRCEVHLFTDSQYLRKGVTLWLPGWIARGWKRKDGVLQNEDLWRRLAELVAEQDVHWEWVKGHAGNLHNERADELATLEIRRQHGASRSGGPAADAEIFLKVSCPGKRGGWAALLRQGDEEQILSGSALNTTSNALDLFAAVTALEKVPPGSQVAIHTGSDYLRNGATRWLSGWQRSGWKTKEGAPVKNRELWQRLAAMLTQHKIDWPIAKDTPPAELKQLGKLAAAAAMG